MSQRFQPFFSNTQRVAPFFFQYDAKNWTLFFEYDAKKRTPFSFIWRKELKHLIKKYDSKNWTVCQKKKKTDSKNGTLYKGLIELNLFLWTSSQYDSKSWSLFFNMTRRIEPFLFSNMTQRIDFQNAQGIEPLFHMIYLLFYMTRIELFFDQYDSKSRIFHKKWLKVLNTFLNLTERVEPFLHWTQRIELFSICLKELSLFKIWVQKWKFFLKKK